MIDDNYIFTVVIPTYNRAKSLVRAINSVISQTLLSYEIIVIDDGSTDNTHEVVRHFSRNNFRYINKTNGGVSSARNMGISLAKGDIIAFLDSDDEWQPSYLEQINHCYCKYNVDYVFSDLIKNHNNMATKSFMRSCPVFKTYISADSPVIIFDENIMYRILLQEIPVKPSALSIRRDVVTKVGPFSENMICGEDWDYLLRLCRNHTAAYLDFPLVTLNVSKNSLHIEKKEEDAKGVIEMLKIYKLDLVNSSMKYLVPSVNRGIGNAHKHLAWYYLENNNKKKAVFTMYRAFKECGDFMMLLRALKYIIKI